MPSHPHTDPVTGARELEGLTSADIPSTPGGGGAGGGPKLETYDPEPTREKVRGQIAWLLLWLLIGMIVFSFLVLSWCEKERWGFLKEFLTIAFGPIIALVGSVTGFYYGSVQKR